jgi:hypothetical protein
MRDRVTTASRQSADECCGESQRLGWAISGSAPAYAALPVSHSQKSDMSTSGEAEPSPTTAQLASADRLELTDNWFGTSFLEAGCLLGGETTGGCL